MTDPSLYSFSDEFLNAIQNFQPQQRDDDFYYPDGTEEEYQPDSSPDEEGDTSDYKNLYDDLSSKYDDLQQQFESFRSSYSPPAYEESPYPDDDPNYVMDFMTRNLLGGAASGNSKYSSNNNFQSFGSYAEGKQALVNQLDLYKTGRTRNPVGPDSTLEEAMSVYAPASDHNDPEGYAKFIASQLHISPDTPISQIDTKQWADAVEKMEGNKTGNNPGNLKKYYIGGQY